MAVKQTAGRDQLGTFAPKFAQLNDDVLFGEVWSREDKLSLRDRSLVTVVSLLSQGLVDSSFQFHLMSAKQNGVTRAEIAEIITHAAFYAGWPKAWAAFRMAKEVWADEEAEQPDGGVFGLGAPNDAYAQYFVGHSYLKPLGSENGVSAANVTCCAPPAAAGIRSGASPRRPSPPAIRWSSRPRSNTGTARPRTAGSPM